jgi:peptidoglycan/xylan/chitin deacetylase (PgdA/CDA1 family)
MNSYRGWFRGGWAGALVAGLFGMSLPARAAADTIVSLTFDDTLESQYALKGMLADAGMSATFYVNSGRIDDKTGLYMTSTQILDLQQSGHEIGGHTVSHADLPAQPSTDEQKRQVCNDRSALINDGFNVTSFAYPFGDTSPDTETIVQGCGYNSARGVGGLVSPATCFGCPFAETTPPTDTYHLATPDSIKQGTSLLDMEGYVTQAENNGGGWVVLVMHYVCDNACNPYSVSPDQLSQFLIWLQARSPTTVVKTVGQVIGGTQQAAVSGPAITARPPAANMLLNPSLELSDAGVTPDYWQKGGSGGTCTYSMVAAAEDGARAEQISCSAFDGGARRLLSIEDNGPLAPPVIEGHVYAVSAWYKADVAPVFSVYTRSTTGGWTFWKQSPAFAASSTWVQATWLTPRTPSGVNAMSVGMTILNVGTLTFDNFGLSDNDTIPPTVSVTAPNDGDKVSGTVTLTASASDDGGISSVDFFINGTDVATATGTTYSATWDSTPASTPPVVAITAQATDRAGNTTLSKGILVTVSNIPPTDTTPPTVSLTAPAANATISGNVSVTASASDDVAVQHVDFLLDGELLSTALASPYSTSWDTSTATEGAHSLTARASDTSGNATTSAAVSVTVDRTAPTVSVSAPLAAADVSGSVSLQATATDNEGLAQVEFFVNGTSVGVVVGAGPYSLNWDSTALANGAATVTATATDNDGNATTSAGVAITVDNQGADTTPPVTTVACNAASCSSGWYQSTVTVTLAATDSGGSGGSGVASIAYTIDGSNPTTSSGLPYSAAFTVSANTTVKFAATDKSGNIETVKSQLIQVDSTAPVTAVTCNGLPCGSGWYGAAVSVALSATDDLSGVATTLYTTDGTAPAGSTASTYANPVVITQTGTMKFASTDVAGNVEQAQSLSLQIDSIAPTSAVTCNTTHVSCSSAWFNSAVTVYMTDSDTGGSGLAGVQYTTDGTDPSMTNGTAFPNSGHISISKATTLKYRAYDNAGNAQAIQTQSVQVDTTPPTGVTITSPAANSTITGTVYIVGTATDNTSGVQRITFYDGPTRLGSQTTKTWTWKWNTSGVKTGAHTLKIVADDNASPIPNSTTSATITVNVK